MNVVRKALNEKLKKIRLQKTIMARAIKELWKYRKDTTEAWSTYTIKGTCLTCGADYVIKNTSLCLNCAFKNPKMRDNNSKLTSNTHAGTCTCGHTGLLTNHTNECLNCYAKNNKGLGSA